MPRPALNASIDDIIQSAVSAAMERVAPRIAKAIADASAAQVEWGLKHRAPKVTGSRRPARRQRRKDITRWVADVRARRVPNFVIEVTGLDTKKIVAKYGESAAFEKGKPLPPEKSSSPNGKEAARAVGAKGPVLRKPAAE